MMSEVCESIVSPWGDESSTPEGVVPVGGVGVGVGWTSAVGSLVLCVRNPSNKGSSEEICSPPGDIHCASSI